MMKRIFLLPFVLAVFPTLAFDTIYVNFSDSAEYDADGWVNVRYSDGRDGCRLADDVSLIVSGGRPAASGESGDGRYGRADGYEDVVQRQYIKDGGWENPTDVTIFGLPEGAYDFTCYMSGDSADDVMNPVDVRIGEGGGDVWFSYDGLGDLVQKKASWGSCRAQGAAELGVNVIKVEAVYCSDGKVVLRTCRDFGRGALAAVVISAHDFGASQKTISVNVSCDEDSAVGRIGVLSGLGSANLPMCSWQNVDDSTRVIALRYWDPATQTMQAADGLTLNWSGDKPYKGCGNHDFVPLRAYVDDNTEPMFAISNINFKVYDLIVYFQADWARSNGDFRALTVNGVAYTWNEESCAVESGSSPWGTHGTAALANGVNALRISSLGDSNLVFKTGIRSNTNGRGGVAAFQIVSHNYVEIIAEGDVDTEQINALAGAASDVLLTLPAGAGLTIGRKPLNCDALIVRSEGDIRIATWNNVAPKPTSVESETFAKVIRFGGGLVFYGWEPTKRILSVNFNSDHGAVPATWNQNGGGVSGAKIPYASWNNIPASADLAVGDLVVWDGDTLTTNSMAGLSLSATGLRYYNYGTSESVFRRGWIDAANSSDHGPIVFSGIPFARYDVIVYQIWDGKQAIPAPKINGECWTWDAERSITVEGDAPYGTTDYHLSAQLGVNAVRVPDRSGSTCVITGCRGGNICAVQFIEYCPQPKEIVKSGLAILLR